MSLLAFFEQLADTPWSLSLHELEIAYSLIESIHVMCLFFGLAVIFDLRLLGKKNGDDHARSLLTFEGNCRHCRGRCHRCHFGARHPDLSSGAGGFRPGAENTLG